MKRKRTFTFWAVAVAYVVAFSASEAAEAPKRVQPPEWSQDVLDAFFEDARDHLVGERPTGTQPQLSAATTATPASAAGQGDGGKFKWSSLIDAEALTSAVKFEYFGLNLSLRKQKSMVPAAKQDLLRVHSQLTVLFGIVADYDEEIRWQSSAKLMQTQAFNAYRAMKADASDRMENSIEFYRTLGELLGGKSVSAAAIASANQPQLIGRPQLMRNMEYLLQEEISPTLRDVREFRKRKQLAADRAQVLAVLAEVIQQDGYEYADDDAYLDEARQLREAARELAEAATDKNYDTARAAAGKIGQSCSRCHEGYRG